jgi:membrane fusion protein (multidrug efflux system)
LPIFIVAGALLAAAIAGGIYYFYARQHETTNDAFIEGDIVQISPKITAYVSKIYVKENQFVHKGDLLAELSPQDYEARLAQAKAQAQRAVQCVPVKIVLDQQPENLRLLAPGMSVQPSVKVR